MGRIKFMFGIAILLAFSATGYGDVSHNQDFPVSGCSVYGS